MKCEGLYDKDGAFFELPKGSRVLHGFLYSLRNKKDCKYELGYRVCERQPKANRCLSYVE